MSIFLRPCQICPVLSQRPISQFGGGPNKGQLEDNLVKLRRGPFVRHSLPAPRPSCLDRPLLFAGVRLQHKHVDGRHLLQGPGVAFFRSLKVASIPILNFETFPSRSFVGQRLTFKRTSRGNEVDLVFGAQTAL